MEGILENKAVSCKEIILQEIDFNIQDIIFSINDVALKSTRELLGTIKLIPLGGNCMFKGTIKHINMHHKLLIIDNIIWAGSYNLTMDAANYNWENAVRISFFKWQGALCYKIIEFRLILSS